MKPRQGFADYHDLKCHYLGIARIEGTNTTGLFGLLAILWLTSSGNALAQQPTFAGNSQHTALYNVPAQPISQARWTFTNDLASDYFAHYAAPLITPFNTVVVPVNLPWGFEISVLDGASGRLKYTLQTDYLLPSFHWEPVYQPVLATSPSGTRLYYPGAGGTVYYITNPDSDTPSAPVQECFYTSVAAYSTNATQFNNFIFINTPITADTNGNIFFGFRVEGGTAPPPLNTTNSGFARIDPAGHGIYVLAGAAAGDPFIYRDSHNCAPALSNDGSTLYVPVKGPDANYAYLLGLDSTTLATKFRVLLRDPNSGYLAGVLDDSTASVTIAPDGEVFFGVLSNPGNGRGWLLHFSADLSTQKPPGGFGWDFTPAIVPTNMVPWYTGTSSYLLFSKYNNYANAADGDGVNKIALLDPNATQLDPHPSAQGFREMREALVAAGCTPDEENQSTNFPYAVREWCINSTAVNPATMSVFAPSEDGRIYRWNLASNSLSETFVLGTGLGAPYVPTTIGPDGAVYTVHDGKLFALGGFTNVGMEFHSAAPDLRSTAFGQPVTFTASVTNLSGSGPTPTGTITFQDVAYQGLSPVTNILAAGMPIVAGLASVATSTLTAGGNYPSNSLGNHFITAIYSGDSNFPASSVALVQKIHASSSFTTLRSSAGESNSVSFTAAITPSAPASGIPSGMVSFWDHSTFLAQIPLDTNAAASFTLAALETGSHAVQANYYSDSVFASSDGIVAATAAVVMPSVLTNGSFELIFSNNPGAPFSVLGSTNLNLSINDWQVLGAAIETVPGMFQFTDSDAPNHVQRFYRVRSP